MDKLAMLSIIIASVAIPVVCAGEPRLRRAAKKMTLAMVIFTAIYVAYVAFVHTRHVPPPWPWAH